MIFELPAAIPVTMPVAAPIVAADVVPEVQDPPPASVKVVVVPGHTVFAPAMAAGNGLTVMTDVILQPVVKE